MANLSGKVALVIGGTRGIGAAISRRLAADGASLVIVYRSRADEAAQIADELGSERALLLQADVSITTELAGAIGDVVDRFGRVDILVLVAGMAITGDLESYGDDAFDRIFALNVRAPFEAVRRLAPSMPDGGRIILIGSIVADRAPGAGVTLYAASKAALGGLVRGLARDLGPRSITANLVQPGPIDTERNPANGPNAEVSRAPLAIRRHGKPEEVASLVGWLTSLSDSRYFLKLCGAAGDLQAALPSGWKLHSLGCFMRAAPARPIGHLPLGYTIEVKRTGMVAEARIFSEAGALAASGYAAETNDVFVYDRIITEPDHRRKGLGRALMQALHGARQNPSATELLVATEDGRSLYSALGWETVSSYSTASIVEP